MELNCWISQSGRNFFLWEILLTELCYLSHFQWSFYYKQPNLFQTSKNYIDTKNIYLVIFIEITWNNDRYFIKKTTWYYPRYFFKKKKHSKLSSLSYIIEQKLNHLDYILFSLLKA